MRMADGSVPKGKESVLSKNKGMPGILSNHGHFCCHLDSLNVLGLPALWAFGHLELHGLPFLKTAKAPGLNSREMYEDILPILTAEKAIASGVVKPLYSFLFPF